MEPSFDPEYRHLQFENITEYGNPQDPIHDMKEIQ